LKGRVVARIMREILKTTDSVLISFAQAVLAEAGIGCVVLDTHMSAMEGSLTVLPRRMMVGDADEGRARAILDEALKSR